MWLLRYKLKLGKYGHNFVRAFCSTVKVNSSRDKVPDTPAPIKWPGLGSPCKLWWVKEITPELYVAGGLTNRQIKYAHDGGFKTIISLYKENEFGNFGEERLATTSDIENIQTLTGIKFKSALEKGDDYSSLDSILKLSECITQAQMPVLLYSNKPEQIAFGTLLHLAYQSRRDQQYKPFVNSDKIYKMATILGMDFTSEMSKSLIAEITGESVVKNPPKPNAVPVSWLGFWLAHPVYKNWFTAGQIRRAHLKEIQAAGFKSVINMRLGMMHDEKPSQEPVTLINVKDSFMTYDGEGKPIRQLQTTLQDNVIDPKLSNAYISPKSQINYERRNEGEYGDDIGHNENIEKEHFKETKLNYHHIPIEMKFNAEVFRQHQDILSEIGEKGPVLVHCTIGARAAFMSVLAAAMQYNLDFDWAIQRVNELGFEVNADSGFTDVYGMYRDILKPGQ